MRISEEFKIRYRSRYSNSYRRQSGIFIIIFSCVHCILYTVYTSWYKQFPNFLRCISLLIPLSHTLDRIRSEYMDDIISVFFSRIYIHIAGDHLTFPVAEKIVIDNDSLVTYLRAENLEHRETMFVTHMIGFIIALSRWYEDYFIRISIVQKSSDNSRVSYMRWIECSSENIDHVTNCIVLEKKSKKKSRISEIIFYHHEIHGISVRACASQYT